MYDTYHTFLILRMKKFMEAVLPDTCVLNLRVSR